MKTDFKNLQIIFLALLIGQIAFAVVANFVITDSEITDTGMLIYLVPVVMITGILAGNYIFNSNLKKISTEKTTEEKFQEYRKYALLRWALMEGGNLLAVAAAIVEAKTLYFALFAVGIVFFAMTRPNIEDL